MAQKGTNYGEEIVDPVFPSPNEYYKYEYKKLDMRELDRVKLLAYVTGLRGIENRSFLKRGFQRS